MTTKKGCLGLIMSIFGGARQVSEASPQWPYQVRASLLTPSEISFYHVLISIVGERAVICPKVNLKDVLFIPGRHDRDYFSYFGRISQKHVDFVMCDAKSMRPMFAIELDDLSHDREDRSERDSFVDDVFHAASLPLLRFPAARAYNVNEITAILEPLITRDGDMRGQSTSVPADHQIPPLCPRHNVPMILRTATKGPNAGQQFYGCPHYPDCREIIRIG